MHIRERKGNLLHYSCLENPMDRTAWRATVHGVTQSWPAHTYTHTQYIYIMCAWVCVCVYTNTLIYVYINIFIFIYIYIYIHVYLYTHAHIGEGKGNPLQYSCLENPMDTGAWWATVHGVPKSWTQLKWHSTYTYICIYLLHLNWHAWNKCFMKL